MNCKHVEALMPLYAGGDIDGRTIGEVLSHVNTCGQCAALAAEYEASRNWLSGAAPDLDEALLADMKRGVMRELQTARSCPGWFELISAALARIVSRPALAVALLLVAFGAATVWFYLAKPASPSQIKLTQDAADKAPQPPGVNESPALIKPPSSSTNDRPRVAVANPRQGKRSAGGSRQASTQNANALPEAQPQSAVARGSGEMLRIEIQTGDPNIRIIWFAPKESDTQQANP